MRCQHPDCKKKVTIIMQSCNKCRCEKIFCNGHKYPNMHNCTFDHKESAKKILRQSLVQVIADKVIAI